MTVAVAPEALALKVFLERKRRERVAALPTAFVDWIGKAKPEHLWTYPHFTAMQGLLDRVTAGDLKRVYFQIPIRHGKTEHNTIGYPVYRLERNPRTRIIVGSYNQRQADKFSREIRRLAKARGVPVSGERDAAGEWETEAGGGVRAVGAGAGVAGVNADLIVIDDPIGSRDEAESPAHRDRVFDWITNDLLARTEPHTAVLLTMSRWHQDDPAGRLLERQRDLWTVLDLPAEAEPNDPLGRGPGDPLWPELRGREWLDEKRVELLEYGFASLLQGRPRPREGGMFKWDWWRTLDSVPVGVRVIRYWDMAGTRPHGRGSDPDYTAGAAWSRLPSGESVLLHVKRFRVEVAARDAMIEQTAKDDILRYGKNKVTYWVEKQAGISGDDATRALLKRLQALGIAVYSEHPTGSKAERATPLASAAMAGNVLLGPDRDGWRDPFRLEAADFPFGKHDDQVDAAAAGFAKLSTPTGSVGFSSLSL